MFMLQKFLDIIKIIDSLVLGKLLMESVNLGVVGFVIPRGFSQIGVFIVTTCHLKLNV